MQQQKHHWLIEATNGLQFKECLECGATTTLEHHFDVIGGDTVECSECGAPHEVTAVPRAKA